MTVSVAHMSRKNYNISFLHRNIDRINTWRTGKHSGPDLSHLNMTPVCGKKKRSLVIEVFMKLRQKDGHLQKVIQLAGDARHLQELSIIFC